MSRASPTGPRRLGGPSRAALDRQRTPDVSGRVVPQRMGNRECAADEGPACVSGPPHISCVPTQPSVRTMYCSTLPPECRVTGWSVRVNPWRRYSRIARELLCITPKVTRSARWSSAHFTAASTRASATPRPRADGSTHIDASSTDLAPSTAAQLAIPTSAPGVVASRFTERSSASRARHRASVSRTPCQSANLAENASGASASAARRRERHRDQPSGPIASMVTTGPGSLEVPIPTKGHDANNRCAAATKDRAPETLGA
jgi:hypothetical protein